MKSNSAYAIIALSRSISEIRNVVRDAQKDGHIDKKEALDIFGALVVACIKIGLMFAADIATSALESKEVSE